MTGSSADRRWRAAAIVAIAAAAAVFVAPGSGFTQSQGPVSLVPPPGDSEDRARAAPQRPAAPAGTLRAIPGASDSGVRIRGLGTVDTDAVGLTGQNAGGLGTDMWRGTSRAVAQHLLTAMPERLASESAHDLARRLLLIAAEPPASTDGDVSLVEIRVEKLIALGATEDAERLLAAVSARALPENLVEASIRARLLTSDTTGACQALGAVNTGLVSEFGQKALIFCQLLDREFSEAVVGLELLREQNLAQDTIFFELSNAVISGAKPTRKQLAKPGDANALNLALLRLSESQVPAWFAEADAPSLLKAVAMMPEADREIRVAAARRAAHWSALSPIELAGVFGDLGINADAAAAVLLEPEKASAGLRLAAAYVAVNSQQIEVALAEVLREMWRLAAEQQDWRLAARMTAPQLLQIRPTPAFSWFAGEAMAASLAAGDTEQALNWFRSAANRGGAGEGSDAALTAMWPALRMATGTDTRRQTAGPQARVFDQSGRRPVAAIASTTVPTAVRNSRLPWDDRRLGQWIAQKEAAAPNGVAAIATQLALFDALGEQVSEAFWLRAEAAELNATAFPPLDIWVGLQRAAADGRVAETALYAVLAVGESELSQLHPAAIHTIIGSLRRVGLSDDARAFALEIAVTGTP